LALSLQSALEAPIIELDSIDSTNNYAMCLIDADTAQNGLTITADEQTAGKGQRGRIWKSEAGESLLMSIITVPDKSLDEQFLFSAAVAVAIAEVLQHEYENWDVRVKWPNDIIINDKKAGGILIENVIKGNVWAYSVVGIGLNVSQTKMPEDIPNAGSLQMLSGKPFNIKKIRKLLRARILQRIYEKLPSDQMMGLYNDYLFRKDKWQGFEDGQREWEACVNGVNAKGELEVTEKDGSTSTYIHGVTNWRW
jgi:BirA family biotin operon repressor/biotin-[acetyl-CoA-carboxylase] ligase